MVTFKKIFNLVIRTFSMIVKKSIYPVIYPASIITTGNATDEQRAHQVWKHLSSNRERERKLKKSMANHMNTYHTHI